MFRVSNNLIGILNLITFLLSVLILAYGIRQAHCDSTSTNCDKDLEKPVIALGVFLMVVSLACFIGACCRVSWLLWFYLLVMFLLIVFLFCYTLFWFLVFNKGAGEVLSGKGYKEYRLGDYSNWLQKRVNSSKYWNGTRSYLLDSKMCDSIENGLAGTTVEQFYKVHLTAIESGCCKPSNDCHFQYASPTSWNRTAATSSLITNPDCNVWNNDPKILCYNCQSCKAGWLDELKTEWKEEVFPEVIVLIILVVMYSIGCCALRNNWEENYFYFSRKPHP